MANYHVTNQKGFDDWRVKRAGDDRAAATVGTQKEAEKIARQLSANSGGGEARIHKPNGGPIRNSDIVSLGRDPFPPQDKKN